MDKVPDSANSSIIQHPISPIQTNLTMIPHLLPFSDGLPDKIVPYSATSAAISSLGSGENRHLRSSPALQIYSEQPLALVSTTSRGLQVRRWRGLGRGESLTQTQLTTTLIPLTPSTNLQTSVPLDLCGLKLHESHEIVLCTKNT